MTHTYTVGVPKNIPTTIPLKDLIPTFESGRIFTISTSTNNECIFHHITIPPGNYTNETIAKEIIYGLEGATNTKFKYSVSNGNLIIISKISFLMNWSFRQKGVIGFGLTNTKWESVYVRNYPKNDTTTTTNCACTIL
jgi:hypothetical protein